MFCVHCGKEVPDGAKFCQHCGGSLHQASVKTESSPQAAQAVTVSPPRASQETEIVADETGEEKPRLDIHELGVKLEEITAQVTQAMGYKTELRQRLEDKMGSKHEIDILATRGSSIIAIECKNFGDNRSVGIEHIRNFESKLRALKMKNGYFVTNSRFSQDAEDFAENSGIKLWDGAVIREKFFTYTIGRLKPAEQVSFDYALPPKTSYSEATRIADLANTGSIRPSQITLTFRPYFRVHYRLNASRIDPVKEKHSVREDGDLIVDGITGEIINLPKTAVGKLLSMASGLLKKGEEREASKLDKIVTEDLLSNTPTRSHIETQTTDYLISKLKPEISDKAAVKTVAANVVERNTRDEHYEVRVGRDKIEKRKFTITPKLSEVSAKVFLIHVPVWDIEFESGQSIYSRRIVASSDRVLSDSLVHCPEHSQLGGIRRVSPKAVCEVCGRLGCEKHILTSTDGHYFCYEHAPPELRPTEAKEEKKGFGFKLPFGR